MKRGRIQPPFATNAFMVSTTAIFPLVPEAAETEEEGKNSSCFLVTEVAR
jgi:hypothetical protein